MRTRYSGVCFRLVVILASPASFCRGSLIQKTGVGVVCWLLQYSIISGGILPNPENLLFFHLLLAASVSSILKLITVVLLTSLKVTHQDGQRQMPYHLFNLLHSYVYFVDFRAQLLPIFPFGLFDAISQFGFGFLTGLPKSEILNAFSNSSYILPSFTNTILAKQFTHSTIKPVDFSLLSYISHPTCSRILLHQLWLRFPADFPEHAVILYGRAFQFATLHTFSTVPLSVVAIGHYKCTCGTQNFVIQCQV